MANRKPCKGSDTRANPYMKDRATCPYCGKDVRVVNYRPKLGGRLAEHQ